MCDRENDDNSGAMMNSFRISGVKKMCLAVFSKQEHLENHHPQGLSKALFIGLALCLMVVSTAMAADYDYVEINNPFLRKIPTAVPVFRAVTSGAPEKEIATEAAGFLSEMLEYTGYFKILDRNAFLADPTNPNIMAGDIQFKNWSGIGAELLVTGGAFIEDDVLKLEMRLFDTFKGELLVGKRYVGQPEDQQRMVRRFCSEILFILTGLLFPFFGKRPPGKWLATFHKMNNRHKYVNHAGIMSFPCYCT